LLVQRHSSRSFHMRMSFSSISLFSCLFVFFLLLLFFALLFIIQQFLRSQQKSLFAPFHHPIVLAQSAEESLRCAQSIWQGSEGWSPLRTSVSRFRFEPASMVLVLYLNQVGKGPEGQRSANTFQSDQPLLKQYPSTVLRPLGLSARAGRLTWYVRSQR
jgi:hypothetical protein